MMNKFVFGDKIAQDGRNTSYKFVFIYNIWNYFQDQVQLNVLLKATYKKICKKQKTTLHQAVK